MSWQLAASALQVAKRATNMRMLDAGLEQPAGLHHLMSSVMHCRGSVVTGADQGKLVGMLGHLRKDVCDFDAADIGLDGFEGSANFRRGVGLGVPGINLARPADQK